MPKVGDTEILDAELYDKLYGIVHRELEKLPPARNPDKPVIVGLRNRSGTDTFNDFVGYVVPGHRRGLLSTARRVMQLKLWKGTTDPGRAPRFRNQGVRRIRPGYYVGVFAFGRHHEAESHPCLRMVGAVDVERFVPGDGEWLPDGQADGSFNGHRAKIAYIVVQVGDFSWGCLVWVYGVDAWECLKQLGYPEHAADFEAQAEAIKTGHKVVMPDEGPFDLLIIDITDEMLAGASASLLDR